MTKSRVITPAELSLHPEWVQKLRAMRWTYVGGYPITDARLDAIPTDPGVYVFVNWAARVLYIGQSGTPGSGTCRSKGESCGCGLRGRIRNHRYMREDLADPARDDPEGVWWSALPGVAPDDRVVLEALLYNHYLPWRNFSTADLTKFARTYDLDPEDWPDARPWHGADIDHPGDCSTWARAGRAFGGTEATN